MLKLDGVRRAQVKELRHEARWLADKHPDVYGAVFIGRKLLPIEGLPIGPVSDRAGSPVLYEVPGPRLLALPVGVAPGQSPPAVACHESGVYGTKQDHHTVAFYGDREGYRRLVELAVSMRDMGVEYSTLGPLANFREWFAAGALLGYLLETADRHNDDEMPIKTIEGTVEHPGWVGPITYYALRPSLTRATSRLLSGTLARDKMIGKATRAAEGNLASTAKAPAVAADDAGDLVTLDQCAAIINVTKRTLERKKTGGRLPEPVVEGGAGRSSLYDWPGMRGWLSEEFGYPLDRLPERYPNIRLPPGT